MTTKRKRVTGKVWRRRIATVCDWAALAATTTAEVVAATSGDYLKVQAIRQIAAGLRAAARKLRRSR